MRTVSCYFIFHSVENDIKLSVQSSRLSLFFLNLKDFFFIYFDNTEGIFVFILNFVQQKIIFNIAKELHCWIWSFTWLIPGLADYCTSWCRVNCKMLCCTLMLWCSMWCTQSVYSKHFAYCPSKARNRQNCYFTFGLISLPMYCTYGMEK